MNVLYQTLQHTLARRDIDLYTPFTRAAQEIATDHCFFICGLNHSGDLLTCERLSDDGVYDLFPTKTSFSVRVLDDLREIYSIEGIALEFPSFRTSGYVHVELPPSRREQFSHLFLSALQDLNKDHYIARYSVLRKNNCFEFLKVAKSFSFQSYADKLVLTLL